VSESVDSVAQVLALMKETFGDPGPTGVFAEYYDGDPEAIPLFNLPALIVDQTGDTTVGAAFEQDDVSDTIVVKIVLNKRDDFDNDKVKALNTTSRKIRDLIARIDPDTGTYAAGTVKHTLRNALFDNATMISNELRVEYGIMPRAGGDGYADLTAEGHVTFDITKARNTN
jgi:hypothetical protein